VFILGAGVAFLFGGFFLFMLTKMYPILQIAYLDWIALILFVAPWIVTLYRISITHTWKLVDKIPLWQHLIIYARRDNEIVPLIGKRTYPGESFMEGGKGLGLLEYLGKDCWYNWGDKKIVWGLENINYTPDPRYFNFTHLLYNIGFTDSDDIKRGGVRKNLIWN